ncbi:MAG: hypothetical protein ACT4PP_02355 [Sporichthyaceae bacterium]
MSPTVASSRDLAVALAQRLGPHLPAGIEVRATDCGLHVDAAGESWAGSDALDILNDVQQWTICPDADEIVERAARSTLSGVQDAIARASSWPWPTVPVNHSAMPGADARLSDGQLLAWFGDENEPALRLDLIAVDVGRLRLTR